MVPSLPVNTRDNHAKIHEKGESYEIWIHHKNSLIEFVSAFSNYSVAMTFVERYNENTN